MGLKLRDWILVGGLAVSALLLAACGSSSTADEGADGVAATDERAVADEASADDPSSAETEDANQEEAPDDTEAPEAADPEVAQRDPEAPFGVDVAYDADAEPLLRWFTPFDPGTYRTGALGTPMSFTTTEVLNTQPNGGGMFVISDVSSRAPDDRDIVFMRAANLSNPVAPNEPIESEPLWPADDFLGWLENLPEGVITTDPVETSVNGLPAIRVDLSIADDMTCGWVPGFCVGFAENNGEQIKALNKGASYRAWMVDQGDEDPLLIVAGIARDDQAPWFERADAVLDTVAFGEVTTNPVQALAPGSTRLDALGGIEVTLPENLGDLTNGRSRLTRMWNGRGFAAMDITERPGTLYFADRPHDMDGNPLASSDEVVTQLTAGGAELTELEATTVDGVDTRVFDVTTADPSVLLRFSPLDVVGPMFGWDSPAAGRLWVFDHPDRGVMMFSTHAFADVDTMLPAVNELGDAIAASLTFVD